MQAHASTNLKPQTEKACCLPTMSQVSWVLNGRAEIQNQCHLLQKTILLTFIHSFNKLSLMTSHMPGSRGQNWQDFYLHGNCKLTGKTNIKAHPCKVVAIIPLPKVWKLLSLKLYHLVGGGGGRDITASWPESWTWAPQPPSFEMY